MTVATKSVVSTEMAMELILKLTLKRNMRVSVCNGEAMVLTKSTDLEAIKAAMYSTDSETLTFWDNEGFGSASVQQGYLNLVHDEANVGLDCVSTAYGKPIEDAYDRILEVVKRIDELCDFQIWLFSRN
jgi:hypothetical protein